MTYLCCHCNYNEPGGRSCRLYDLPKQEARDQCKGDYFYEVSSLGVTSAGDLTVKEPTDV